MEIWTIPEASDEQFRAAGFTREARNYPRSELGARFIASFNGIPSFDRIPAAWCYASNPYMLGVVEQLALDALQS